jgi:hypothetical protein
VMGEWWRLRSRGYIPAFVDHRLHHAVVGEGGQGCGEKTRASLPGIPGWLPYPGNPGWAAWRRARMPSRNSGLANLSRRSWLDWEGCGHWKTLGRLWKEAGGVFPPRDGGVRSEAIVGSNRRGMMVFANGWGWPV